MAHSAGKTKGRWEAAIRAFERADERTPPPKGAILFVGSSSIRLWKTLARDFAPWTVIQRGYGGSRLTDLLGHANRIIIPYRPKIIVLYEGENDVAEGIPARRVCRELRLLVSRLKRALPRTVILFGAIKPSILRFGLWPQMRRVNRCAARYAAKTRRLSYLDLAAPLLDRRGRLRRKLFASDGLHLSRAGYAAWTRVLKPAIAKHLSR